MSLQFVDFGVKRTQSLQYLLLLIEWRNCDLELLDDIRRKICPYTAIGCLRSKARQQCHKLIVEKLR